MASIVLVPGFWLGAWAWDEVAGLLRNDGHDVTAVTLPGLESPGADRSSITAEDHVAAVCDAVCAAGDRVVLAVHSGSGFPGYAATDRVPERIAAMVYVDSGPGVGAMDPDFADVDKPIPATWEDLGEDLTGISDEQLETFRNRAVPQPGGPMREAVALTNDARLDIPTTLICTAWPSSEMKASIDKGYEFIGGLTELRNVEYVDLPTSHWPMWSRPKELAAIISDVAKRS